MAKERQEKRVKLYLDIYALSFILLLWVHHIYDFPYSWFAFFSAALFLLPIYGLKILRGIEVAPKEMPYLYLLSIVALLALFSLGYTPLAFFWFYSILLSFLLRFPLFTLRRPLFLYSLLGIIGIAALLTP